MADSKDETGRGAGGGRPYATIDLKATEVRGTAESGSQSRTGAGGPSWTAPFAATWAWMGDRERAMPVLTHIAAGLAGGAIVLGAFLLSGGPGGAGRATAKEVAGLEARLSELEGAIGGRANTPGLRSRLDALARTATALDAASTKLSSEMKAIGERIGSVPSVPPELSDRLAKLETAVTSLSVSGGGDANDVVRAGLERFERELAGAKDAAGRLAERIDRSEQAMRTAQAAVDGLKAEIERAMKDTAKASDLAPLSARVAALGEDLQGFVKSEAERTANASRIVLTLELANLKRAIERGSAYTAELAAVKKVAGDRLKLSVFERYAGEGLPPLADLMKSFRQAANAMIDAETEPVNGSLVDRLMSGAQSVVRIRKSGYAADDASLEAILARMEAALKENRLGDVLAQGKKLPPKAALAGEDWLKRIEMRYQIEQALAETEAALKSSLAAGPAGSDRKQ